jgi:hypothetical protein
LGEYSGVERRCRIDGDSFCGQHIPITNTLTGIESAVKNIEANLVDSKTLNRNILLSFLGIFVTIVTAIVVFAFWCGGIENQIKVNTHRIDILEQIRG